jgi:hypothetical protein
MTKECVLKKIEYLNPNTNQQYIVEKTIKQLSKIDQGELQYLFFPPDKALWENCARVLQLIGFPRLNNSIALLLEWLQDLNYPGIEIILKICSGCERTKLVEQLEKSLFEAASDQDEQWIGGLKLLVQRLGVKDSEFKDKGLFTLIIENDFY